MLIATSYPSSSIRQRSGRGASAGHPPQPAVHKSCPTCFHRSPVVRAQAVPRASGSTDDTDRPAGYISRRPRTKRTGSVQTKPSSSQSLQQTPPQKPRTIKDKQGLAPLRNDVEPVQDSAASHAEGPPATATGRIQLGPDKTSPAAAAQSVPNLKVTPGSAEFSDSTAAVAAAAEDEPPAAAQGTEGWKVLEASFQQDDTTGRVLPSAPTVEAPCQDGDSSRTYQLQLRQQPLQRQQVFKLQQPPPQQEQQQQQQQQQQHVEGHTVHQSPTPAAAAAGAAGAAQPGAAAAAAAGSTSLAPLSQTGLSPMQNEGAAAGTEAAQAAAAGGAALSRISQTGLAPAQGAGAAIAVEGSAGGLVLSKSMAQQLVPRPLWGLLNERIRPWHRQVRQENVTCKGAFKRFSQSEQCMVAVV